MPRRKLLQSDFFPYHITARANNKEPFHLSMEEMWQTLTSECLFIQILYEVEFHALVLMPNHFHLLMTVPKLNLGVVMRDLMSHTTRKYNLLSGRKGHCFGGPYHWSLVDSSQYYSTVLKYVYRNPVKAGLCLKTEDYAFSTIFGLLGNGHLPFPIHFTRAGMEAQLPNIRPDLWLPWLNEPFSKDLVPPQFNFFRFCSLLS